MMKILYIFLLFTCTVSAQVPDLLMASIQQSSDSNPELIIDGGFDVGVSEWTAINCTTNWNNSNTMQMLDDGSYTQIYQAITTTIGVEYTLSFYYAFGGTFHYGWSTTTPVNTSYVANDYTTTADPSTITLDFTATSTTTYITFGTESTNSGVIDNVSVLKKI